MVGVQGKKDTLYSNIRWKLSTVQRILLLTGVKKDPVVGKCFPNGECFPVWKCFFLEQCFPFGKGFQNLRHHMPTTKWKNSSQFHKS
jgi:hypothetical protein